MSANIIFHTPTIQRICEANMEGKIKYHVFKNLLWLHYEGYRITLVGIKDYSRNELKIGIAICSYPDNFNKKIGVELATKRAEENPVATYMLDDIEIHSNKHCLKVLQDEHAIIVENLEHYKRLLGGKKN